MARMPNRDGTDTISGAPVVSRGTTALFFALVLLGLSGCTSLRDWTRNGFKVGPNYCGVNGPTAPEWIDYNDPRNAEAEQTLAEWWEVFNDPVLNELIETSYRQNLSLRVAGERILEARAQRGIAAGNLWPQKQELFGDFSRTRLSAQTANPPSQLLFNNWEAGAGLAWEFDFWGRYRRAIEASDAHLDATIENYDDVLVILLSDVARSYVQYRTFQERIVYAQHNVEIQTRSLQLADDKFKAGAATERDVQQARQILEQTRALIPQLEIGMGHANNSLCVLLGVPPQNLAMILQGQPAIPNTPRDVAIGIPADLIRRRPDLRRAEREVAAQSALIGVAESDLYPSFSLVGTLGVQAENFNDMFAGQNAFTGVVSPGVRWDVLNYGRLVNNVRVHDARFEALAYAYQEQVLRAGREAEDAIVTYKKGQEEADRLDASVVAARRTYEITYDQYKVGAVDFTPLFLFESTLADQQDQLAESRGRVALGLIDLYRALGGGWQMRLIREGCVLPFESSPPPAELLPPVPAGPPMPMTGQPTPAAGPPMPTIAPPMK